MALTKNALTILKKRYLLRNNKGKLIETPEGMFKRVAKAIASGKKQEKEFYEVMKELLFLPNSPTLMNAGTSLGQLSACFVLPIEDSLRGIFNTIKYMALIQQSGGGTGFNFSNIRPKGDSVRTTKGKASGPISFMHAFNEATEEIRQGGKRRGANMAILNVNHPDILEFINMKQKPGVMTNFNVSVAVTDAFMQAVKENKSYGLINPRNNKKTGKLNARKVFEEICHNAWKTGDPGLIFIDEINRKNPTPKLGRMEATNPCAEVPALPFESCNLGSINLAKMIKDCKTDYELLEKVVRTGVRFLDNVIDKNRFPLKQTEQITKANRKIGLGVMGFAEMIIQLGISYESADAVKTAEKVMKFIQQIGHSESEKIAKEKKAFPNIKKSKWKKKLRNATVTTIAPTGTISMIAGCSSGIEPLFAVAYTKEVLEGTKLTEANKYFEKTAKKRGFYSKKLMQKIANHGTLHGIKEIPSDVKKLFKTAMEISPEQHLKMQKAFQKYTDNAVSKTINLPHRATVKDVKKIFMKAYELKLKGITVFRYGSKTKQVLYVPKPKEKTCFECA